MNIADIDPFRLPSVLLQNRAYLPNAGGVYFVLENKLILYIGQTGNLQNRWKSHHRFPQLNGKKEVLISWIQCEQPERLRLEQDLIKLYSPLLNRQKILQPEDPDRVTITLPRFMAETIQLISEQQGGRPLEQIAMMCLELGMYEYIEKVSQLEHYKILVAKRKQIEKKASDS